MEKPRQYIIQIFSILLFFAAYLICVQNEESSYDMHIDDPLSGCTISRAPKFPIPHHDNTLKAYSITHDKSHGKGNTNKHISLYVMLPVKRTLPVINGYQAPTAYVITQENYQYLYFKEINPPPPKAVC